MIVAGHKIETQNELQKRTDHSYPSAQYASLDSCLRPQGALQYTTSLTSLYRTSLRLYNQRQRRERVLWNPSKSR